MMINLQLAKILFFHNIQIKWELAMEMQNLSSSTYQFKAPYLSHISHLLMPFRIYTSPARMDFANSKQ